MAPSCLNPKLIRLGYLVFNGIWTLDGYLISNIVYIEGAKRELHKKDYELY